MAIPNPVRATPKFPTKAAKENIIVGLYIVCLLSANFLFMRITGRWIEL